MIDFKRYFCGMSMLEWFYTFLTATTTDLLDAELSSQFQKALPSQEPRRIAIGLDLTSSYLKTSGLKQLYQILAAYAKFEPDQDESSSCQVVQYVITSLNLSQSNLSEPQDYEILTKIMLLQSPRVAIQHLNLAQTLSPTPHIESISGFQKFVQRVVRDDTSNLQELVVGGGAVDYTHFAAICSALRYSTKMKALRIEQSPAILVPVNSSAVWSWFALALMHPSSMSKLSALAIPYVHIFAGDVAKAQQTLASPHPAFVTFATKSPELAETIEREDDVQLNVAGKTFVTVKRSAKLRMEPKTRGRAIDLSKNAIDRPLEVVATLSKWTCVIVPGYGFGWVGNAAIVTHDDCEIVSRKPIPLRSFMWVSYSLYNGHNIGTVEALLQLIGERLTALYLSRTQVMDAELARILSYCQSLKHLEIPSHNLRSLGFLREDTPRSLRSLNIRPQAPWQQDLLDPPADQIISDLTSFLTGPSSSQLQQLAFELSQDDCNQVKQLVSVLRQHPAVEIVNIAQNGPWDGEHIHDELKTLDDQIIGLRSPPMATKLAFLSVIHQNERALGRIDAILVSMIFTFASAVKQRRVSHK
ncbi:hypothetical protein Poli38472_011113 [Pythium oligandrum]|uniref:Uncharacterized protein n=1 Tax=Pythium oligandrum TaxID=41045 RepID=A0A8K1CSG7_PYTOL|nr:hypothetical protein Poli38472_011113 [Pythium oligandrum]|eukprot:TMW67493.1 hypothetical protein Poli38472_011113 [Pythium oligandrum]